MTARLDLPVRLAAGQQAWTTPGSYSFVVPAGVTRIWVLALGAGGAGGVYAGHSGGAADSNSGGAGGGSGGGYGGAGVGILGKGSTGGASSPYSVPGSGGTSPGNSADGGQYGGGAGPGGVSGGGAVRILWGDGRSYPSNAADV